jgi:hypothetical protein
MELANNEEKMRRSSEPDNVKCIFPRMHVLKMFKVTLMGCSSDVPRRYDIRQYAEPHRWHCVHDTHERTADMNCLTSAGEEACVGTCVAHATQVLARVASQVHPGAVQGVLAWHRTCNHSKAFKAWSISDRKHSAILYSNSGQAYTCYTSVSFEVNVLQLKKKK